MSREVFRSGPRVVQLTRLAEDCYEYTHWIGERKCFTIPLFADQYEKTVLGLLARGYICRSEG